MNQNQNDSVKNQPAEQKNSGKKKQQRPNKGGKPAGNNKQHQKTPGDEKRNVTSLQDLKSLVRMAPKSAMKPKYSIRAPLPNLMSYKGDGIDHVNISTAARTDLGKALCSSTFLKFDHPILGKFDSIMAFNFYVTSAERDDRMRTASPKELRLLADVGTKIPVVNLWTLVCYATWVQVDAYPAVVEAIRENTLPFDLYKQRNLDGKPVSLMRPEMHDVFLEIVNAISKAIKTNEPLTFRGSNLERMIKLTEEFSAIGQVKSKDTPTVQKNPTAALLAGVDKKALGEDIDRIHEQIVDPSVSGHPDIAASVVSENHDTVVCSVGEDGMNWARKTLKMLVEDLYLNNNNEVLVEVGGNTYRVFEKYFSYGGIHSDDNLMSSKQQVVEKQSDVDGEEFTVLDAQSVGDQVFVALKGSLTKAILVAQKVNVQTTDLPVNEFDSDKPLPETGDAIRAEGN